MGLERNLSLVAPILLTADGGMFGQLQLVTTLGLFVKQIVTLQSPNLPPLNVQIKRVLSTTQVLVGSPQRDINHRIDVSAYTVTSGSFLFATEQPKAQIDMESRLYASYIQEPSNSWRTTPVDSFGNSFDSTNPMPVAFDGTISIGEVGIVGRDPDKNQLAVNPDGSINVIIESIPSSTSKVVSTYNEILLVASGSTTQVATYTVPVSTQSVLQRCPVSGENVATYYLLINGVRQDTVRTMFGGDLSNTFDFTSGNDSGLVLVEGDIVSVQVNNYRPDACAFNARIQVLEIAI